MPAQRSERRRARRAVRILLLRVSVGEEEALGDFLRILFGKVLFFVQIQLEDFFQTLSCANCLEIDRDNSRSPIVADDHLLTVTL